jgi:Hemolysin coregulated protein Hcp (TssD)
MYNMILEIEGRTYLLSSINMNRYNRGSAYDPNPNDHTIQFQIKTAKMDNFMWGWVNGDDIQKKSGRIKFIDATTSTALQTFSFENGYSISHNMNFYNSNDVNSEVNITIAASKIRVEAHEITTTPVTPGRASTDNK